MGKPKRVTKFSLEKIDRVAAGAQDDAHITLVKSRTGRAVRVSKLIDPASIDARITAVRDSFRGNFSEYGCCAGCGWVYCDAVYDDHVIAESDGKYWEIPYTISATNDVEFDDPTSTHPTVTWAPGDITEGAPVAVSKSLWQADPAERVLRRREAPKETDMPAKVKKSETAVAPDLSALDDETRAAVEAVYAEHADLTAAAETEPVVVDEPEVEIDEDDVATIEGLRKAIKKSRSPETKRILEASLARIEKSEKAAADNEARTVRLEKAERTRLFKSIAEPLAHVAPHFADEADADPLDGLAGVLDDIDKAGGEDLRNRVVKAFGAIQTQAVEMSRSFTPRGSSAAVDMASRARLKNSTVDDLDRELSEKVIEVKKSHPELTDAQAEVRVMNADPDFRRAYAENDGTAVR